MTAVLNNTSKALLKNLGYEDVNQFVISQSKRILTEKMQLLQKQIENYEQKYGMDYQEFVVRVKIANDPILHKFSIIEKENDDNAWEDTLSFIELYQKRLQEL
jgi:hypothetical protein